MTSWVIIGIKITTSKIMWSNYLNLNLMCMFFALLNRPLTITFDFWLVLYCIAERRYFISVVRSQRADFFSPQNPDCLLTCFVLFFQHIKGKINFQQNIKIDSKQWENQSFDEKVEINSIISKTQAFVSVQTISIIVRIFPGYKNRK